MDRPNVLDDDSYFDLGSYHRPVDTDSPAAQRWFDRGMVWQRAVEMPPPPVRHKVIRTKKVTVSSR